MPLKFFTIPIQDSGNAEAELNAFLCSHKILAVDRRWVDQGSASFWAIRVDYLEAPTTSGGSRGARRGKVDYKEVLSAEEFSLFAKLRDLRKEIAQAEAVPVYTIFTNEQLAHMVQAGASTKADLEKIAGVGDARIEKYGPRVLELLAPQDGAPHETDGQSV